MKTYTIKFDARLNGAIGVRQSFHSKVKATNEAAAKERLYNTYEHIHIKSIKADNE